MSKNLQKTIGKNLKKARESKHLTQLEVAEAVDINVNYYSRLERGESFPSVQLLEKLSKLFKVKSSSILPF